MAAAQMNPPGTVESWPTPTLFVSVAASTATILSGTIDAEDADSGTSHTSPLPSFNNLSNGGDVESNNHRHKHMASAIVATAVDNFPWSWSSSSSETSSDRWLSSSTTVDNTDFADSPTSSPSRLGLIPIDFVLAHLKSDHLSANILPPSSDVNLGNHQSQHLLQHQPGQQHYSSSLWPHVVQNVSSSSSVAFEVLRSAADSVVSATTTSIGGGPEERALSGNSFRSMYNGTVAVGSGDRPPSSTSTLADLPLLSSILTWDTMITLVLPYGIIFVLAVVGNLLVIITLTLDRSMRSVTNIFLLNLAISDLLLGVFCMPFTLVGVLLRRFIFGAFMCHLISYFQAVSVAVSVWTLVAMSIERYYAICHPFRSRESRQTRKHAYKILAVVWTMAFILMSPTAIVSRLQRISDTDHYKCREAWFTFGHKQTFTIFLDIVLLIIPLLIMVMTYSSIAVTLKQNDMIHKNAVAAATKQLMPAEQPIHHHSRHQHCMTTSFCQNHTSTAMATANSNSSISVSGSETAIVNGDGYCHNGGGSNVKQNYNKFKNRPTTATKSSLSLCRGSKKRKGTAFRRPTAIAAGSLSNSNINNNHYDDNGSGGPSGRMVAMPPTQLSPPPPLVVVHSPTDQPPSPLLVLNHHIADKRNGHHEQNASTTTTGPHYQPVAANFHLRQTLRSHHHHQNNLCVPRTSILRVNSNYSNGPNRQRRIITMLFVVVIEFFICWTPIFLIDTMALYNPRLVYGTSQKVSRWIGIDIISLCHLLCFCSSCTNPITYCFMNRRFRDHFMAMFRCRSMKNSHHHPNNHSTTTATNISEIKCR